MRRALVLTLGFAAGVGCASAPAPTPIVASAPVAGDARLASPDVIRGPANYLRGYPARNDDDTFNVVVEIPAGTLAKFEVDKGDGSLRWTYAGGERRVVRYLPYPGNYGMVPRTLLPKDLGGDGDPIDVLILGAAMPRGQVAAVRFVGVLRLVDRGETDDKLIAVPVGEGERNAFSDVTDLASLDRQFPGVRDILATWFSSYKGPGKAEVSRWGDADEALELASRAASAFLD